MNLESERWDEEVAVFIPTHNRKKLLLRNLNWLQDSPLKIYIADSSDPQNSSLAEIKALNKLKAEPWIFYTCDPGKNVFHKLSDALSSIAEAYVVVCPDDDFIFWQNIPYFYNLAVLKGATTVCGRDLTYKKNDSSSHIFTESSRYRKFSIRNHESRLEHIIAAMDPMVCTYYQFHKTSNLQAIWKYLNSQKVNLLGGKFVEILFRSACFIDGPVYFCDKILRVIGESPALREYDQSQAIQEYNLDFVDEFKAIKKSDLLKPLVSMHAEYLSSRLGLSVERARRIVIENILTPSFNRLNWKHEILWEQPYALLFTSQISEDKIIRKPRGLIHSFSMQDESFRCPLWAKNLDDYWLADCEQWDLLLNFAKFNGG